MLLQSDRSRCAGCPTLPGTGASAAATLGRVAAVATIIIRRSRRRRRSRCRRRTRRPRYRCSSPLRPDGVGIRPHAQPSRRPLAVGPSFIGRSGIHDASNECLCVRDVRVACVVLRHGRRVGAAVRRVGQYMVICRVPYGFEGACGAAIIVTDFPGKSYARGHGYPAVTRGAGVPPVTRPPAPPSLHSRK